MIEIFQNTTNDIITVMSSDGHAYEYTSEEDAIAKARELCDCTDDFEIIPFFEDDEF